MKDAGQGRRPSARSAAHAPWWAGLGPLGGGILVLAGLSLLAWLFLGGHSADEEWGAYYGAGKAVAIGAVIAGTALVSKGRNGGAGDGTDADGEAG
ncbi:hypothetical protein FRZ03_07655 [Streptomyces misionensis]|uniref:Uncharacterized protein n=1 Tax=Streptomyces misionensis TaxID=67331 RepID=A0A5C6JY12_9ACTN|nr:hypothetical protein [Streptomyces misionensis]TWV55565.1 hypothetical protein FRZ03_07655 [Streptomyces misionensis]